MKVPLERVDASLRDPVPQGFRRQQRPDGLLKTSEPNRQSPAYRTTSVRAYPAAKQVSMDQPVARITAATTSSTRK
jgi:hypothetical protein